MNEENTASLSVLAVEVRQVRQDIEQLNARLETSAGVHVTRNEWLLRNSHVDAAMTGLGREIAQLRADAAARRMPWPSVLSSLVAVASLAVTVVVLITP